MTSHKRAPINIYTHTSGGILDCPEPLLSTLHTCAQNGFTFGPQVGRALECGIAELEITAGHRILSDQVDESYIKATSKESPGV